MFGYKNHVNIDRRHGFIRRFVVTHAACQDGSQLAGLLDATNTASEVRADAAYRSRTNLTLLNKRSLIAQFRRAKTRARVRSRVQHVFAAERRRMQLLVRTISRAPARAKITLASLTYNLSRSVSPPGRAALA